MHTGWPKGLILTIALALAQLAQGADASHAQADPAAGPPALSTGDALVMLDYQSIPIRGYPSVDLMGVHLLNRFNDWLYLGIGSQAPLFKGAYGGFMAFDATVHVQHDLVGRVYGDVGASLGGGAGGNSAQQARIITGAGGFIKTYAGLGYRFDDFSMGLNVSKIRFTQSVIDGTQVDFFVQVPFSYTIGSYESTGRHGTATRNAAAGAPASVADANVLSFGLDNFIQVRPKGTYTGTVDVADLQFSHFVTDTTYVLVEGGIGVRGLPTYNEVLGGVGYRYAVDRRLKIAAQLAIGSGGYDPEKFDTGPGLLVYPKLVGEYRLTDSLGVALTGGVLFAPRGTSRNVTVGAALTYRLSPDRWNTLEGEGTGDRVHQGYRYHLFQQSELHPKIGDRQQGAIKMLSTQVDVVVDDHLYLPLQASIAYDRFLGYPGYGEGLAGVGLQTKYAAGQPLQAFAQFMAGINVHGLIVKPALGLNYGLSDRVALFAQVGETSSVNATHLYPERYRFNATNVGVGLSYRFSLPM